ncbi:MAG: MarR family winged helix-turn-helix transcriptional regulator [Chloroflexota bacterium]|nr:MarR family winged helix-turn-helix transcriptional regulator [Chloroflexota bacterium]
MPTLPSTLGVPDASRGAETLAAPDALRGAGTIVLLARTLDQQLRLSAAPDAPAFADLSVLRQIERGVDLPSQVARALRLDPARVTHITDRLVAQGYIERTVDDADRRRWRLRLTTSGCARLKAGQDHLAASMDHLLTGLSDDERAGFLRGLEGVRRVLDGLTTP